MRDRTPGFVGERLREGREARGLTQVALAEILGVSKQAVSLYESGRHSPQPSVFDQIISVLNLPPVFFLRGRPEISTSTVYYRSMSATTQSAMNRAEHKARWSEEIALHLERHILFPTIRIPNLCADSSLGDLTDEEVEAAARETREDFGLGDGAVPNMVHLLEGRGVLVLRQVLDSEKIDSFSYWSEALHRPVVVLGADKASAFRSRLDAAHELAHLVLHRHATVAQLKNSQILARIEKEAYAYGGAFLMPMPAFADDVLVASLDSLVALKRKWNVSVGAMLKRIEGLGLWPETTMQRLWRNYGRSGYRTREPLDDRTALEQPVLAKQAFEMLAKSARGSLAAMLGQMPIHGKEIERLFGLDDGFISTVLEEHPLGIRNLPPTGSQPPITAANVIQFPSRRRFMGEEEA